MGERWDFADCYAKSVRSGGATSDSAGRIALRLDDAGRAVLLVLADGKELVRHQVGRGVRSVEERQQRVELLLANLTRVTVATAEAASLAASLRALRDGALENVPKWVPEAQRLVSRSPKTKFLLSRDRTPTQPTKARPEQKAKGAHPLHSSRWLSNFNLSGRNTALSQRRGWSSGGRKAAIPHARLELLQGPSRFSRQPSASAVPRPRARAFPWGPAQPKREEKQAQGHAGSQGHASDAGGKGRLAAGGLANLGNTCFLNAVLQALLGLPCFAADLLQPALLEAPLLPALSFYAALARLFERKSEGQAVTTADLRAVKEAISRNARQFAGNAQQDAHEFLCQLVDQLEADVAPCIAADASVAAAVPTARCFYSEVLHTLACTACGATTGVTELYHDFSLGIPSAGNRDLQSMVEAFFEAESVERQCECGQDTAQITHRFSVLPRVLVLHLKRFKVTEAGDVDKETAAVTAPIHLDVGPLVEEDTLYPLPYNPRKRPSAAGPPAKRPRADAPSPSSPSPMSPASTSPLSTAEPAGSAGGTPPAASATEEPLVVDLTESSEGGLRDSLGEASRAAGRALGLLSSSDQLELALEESRREAAALDREDALREERDLKEAMRLSREEAAAAAALAAAVEASAEREGEGGGAVQFLAVPRDRCRPCGAAGAHGRYRLAARVCHIGATLGCGHYTTDAWEAAAGRWRTYDDTVVADAEESEVLGGVEGYLYFYVHEAMDGAQ